MYGFRPKNIGGASWSGKKNGEGGEGGGILSPRGYSVEKNRKRGKREGGREGRVLYLLRPGGVIERGWGGGQEGGEGVGGGISSLSLLVLVGELRLLLGHVLPPDEDHEEEQKPAVPAEKKSCQRAARKPPEKHRAPAVAHGDYARG